MMTVVAVEPDSSDRTAVPTAAAVRPYRQISVAGDTISGDTTAITREVRKILDSYSLPDGYTVDISGE